MARIQRRPPGRGVEWEFETLVLPQDFSRNVVTRVLVDRAESAYRWELDAFGSLLGLPVVELDELALRGDRVVLREGGRPVDVVLRRTSEERLRTDAGALTGLGELFVRPLRAGTVAVVNAFGTGVAAEEPHQHPDAEVEALEHEEAEEQRGECDEPVVLKLHDGAPRCANDSVRE